MFALVERLGLEVLVTCFGLVFVGNVGCGSRSTLELARADAASGRGGASAAGTSAAAGGKVHTGGNAASIGGSASATGGSPSDVPKSPPSLVPPNLESTPPTLCNIDHWCGANADFVAIWGSAPGDIWIVADYSGDLENTTPSPYPGNRSALLHWNGSAWSASQFPEAVQLRSISGSAADDVWVVGDASFIAHYDGNAWTSMVAPVPDVTLTSIAVSKPNDVWAVGTDPTTVLHFNGTAWSTIDEPHAEFRAVWASRDVVWLGAVKSPPFPPNGNVHFATWPLEITSIWGRSDASAIAVGEGFIDEGPELRPTARGLGCTYWPVEKRTFRGVWGFGENDIWAVGDQGTVFHWDGTTCSEGPHVTDATLNAAWGYGQTLWIVGNDGTFLEADSTHGSINVTSTLNSLRVSRLWGSAPDDVWALGRDAMHWDGMHWTRVDSPVRFDTLAVWGSGRTDIWATGLNGPNLHWDGAAWREVILPTSLSVNGIWGSASNDVWAVGLLGDVMHFDGAEWRVERKLGEHLSAVWGNSATDIIAVGGANRFRFDGNSWSLMPPRGGQELEYRVAFGSSGVWMAGDIASSPYESKPTLSRWNGQSLQDALEPNGSNGQVTLPTKAVATAGWAGAEDDVWLALPQVVHWNGLTWQNSAVSGHSDSSANALWGTATDLWAITGTGRIMRRRR